MGEGKEETKERKQRKEEREEGRNQRKEYWQSLSGRKNLMEEGSKGKMKEGDEETRGV